MNDNKLILRKSTRALEEGDHLQKSWRVPLDPQKR